MTTNPEQRPGDHVERDRELTEQFGNDRTLVDMLSAHADRRQRLHDRQVRNLSVDVARAMSAATSQRRSSLVRVALPMLAAASVALFMLIHRPDPSSNDIAPGAPTPRHVAAVSDDPAHAGTVVEPSAMTARVDPDGGDHSVFVTVAEAELELQNMATDHIVEQLIDLAPEATNAISLTTSEIDQLIAGI